MLISTINNYCLVLIYLCFKFNFLKTEFLSSCFIAFNVLRYLINTLKIITERSDPRDKVPSYPKEIYFWLHDWKFDFHESVLNNV